MKTAQIIPLILLLLLAGFFAGTTIAFLFINRFSMEIKQKKGLMASRILAQFTNNPIRFAASCIIGYLACVVIFSILFNFALTFYWEKIPFGSFNSIYLKIVLQVIITGLLVGFISLLVPRSLFRAQANRLLPFFAFPISFFSRLLYPVANIISGLANWILKYLFNVKITVAGLPFEQSDVGINVLQPDKERNGSQNFNTAFFENAFNLPQIKIRACLIPRKEIQALEINHDIPALKKRFVETKFSKLIIYENTIDSIKGYVHQLDLFNHPQSIKAILHPIIAVPETMSVINLLTRLTQERKSIAWVVDEFGGTAGIVTMEDLLEEIFGDIRDEHDKNDLLEQQIAEKEYLLSGRLEINHLEEKYNFAFGKTDSETLSGYIIAHYGSIPHERDRIIINDFEFSITHVSETRIEMVKMRQLG